VQNIVFAVGKTDKNAFPATGLLPTSFLQLQLIILEHYSFQTRISTVANVTQVAQKSTFETPTLFICVFSFDLRIHGAANFAQKRFTGNRKYFNGANPNFSSSALGSCVAPATVGEIIVRNESSSRFCLFRDMVFFFFES
jgi:hypothetical protein